MQVNEPDEPIRAEIATDLVENPQLLSLATPTVERRNLAKIDGAITDGLLTPASKLGVLTESCPNSVKAWNDTVKPYLAKRGIPVTTSFQLGCPRGSADAAGCRPGAAGSARSRFVHVSEIAHAADPNGGRAGYSAPSSSAARPSSTQGSMRSA